MSKKFDLSVLRLNPKNPFPFEGTAEQWEEFKSKIDTNDVFCEANRIAYDSSDENLVIAGNKRTKAFIELERTKIPSEWVIDVKDWTKEQRREYIVASNKNWGTWSEIIIETEFADLAFDYDITFDEPEEVIEETDYSEKNKEIDVDDLGDEMKIALNFDSSLYWEVKKRLSEIAQTPEAAILKLLGIEEDYEQSA